MWNEMEVLRKTFLFQLVLQERARHVNTNNTDILIAIKCSLIAQSLRSSNQNQPRGADLLSHAAVHILRQLAGHEVD